MSRVAIFGADSELGRELVSAAITQGFRVHAIVTDARRVTRAHASISTFEANLASGEGVDAAVAQCDYIVCEAFAPWAAGRGLLRLAAALHHFGSTARMVFLSRLDEGLPRKGLARVLGGQVASVKPEELLERCPLRSTWIRYPRFVGARLPGPLEVVGADEPAPAPLTRMAFAGVVMRSLEREIWGRAVSVGSCTRVVLGGEQIDWRAAPLMLAPQGAPRRSRPSRPGGPRTSRAPHRAVPWSDVSGR